MQTDEYAAELSRAGANVGGRWSAALFLARRYPLGAIGAAIMIVFVFAALFSEFLTIHDPLSTNAALSLAPPGAGYWTSNNACGKPPKSWIVFGLAIAVTAVPRVNQCAEIARIALGLGTFVPRLRQASVYRLRASVFIGLPWPKKMTGMRTWVAVLIGKAS